MGSRSVASSVMGSVTSSSSGGYSLSGTGGHDPTRPKENAVSFPTGDRMVDRYIGIKRIGAGTFADIWEVYDQYDPSRKHWALKVLKAGKYMKAGGSVDPNKRAKYESAMVSEGNRIRKLNKQDWQGRAPLIRCKEMLNGNLPQNHPALLALSSGSGQGIRPCIVLELMGISLLQYIQICERKMLVVQLATVRAIAVQLFAAMSFLHGVGGYIHADLKPENVLISLDDSIGGRLWSNGLPRIKVVDLGNALSYHRSINTFEVQSLYYRAPEVLFGNELSSAIDMWSVGCILLELININEFNRHRFWPSSTTQKVGESASPRPGSSSTSNDSMSAPKAKEVSGDGAKMTSPTGSSSSRSLSAMESGAGSSSVSSSVCRGQPEGKQPGRAQPKKQQNQQRRPMRRAHHALLSCRSTTELAQKMHSVLSPFPVFVFNPFYSFHFEQMAAAFCRGPQGAHGMTHNNPSYSAMKMTRKRNLMRRLNIDSNATEYEDFIDLIAGLLDFDPATRYTSEDAIEHEFCIGARYLDAVIVDMISKNFDSAYPDVSISSDLDRQHRLNQEVHQYHLLRSVAVHDSSSTPIPQKRALTQRESAFVAAFPPVRAPNLPRHNRALCVVHGCCANYVSNPMSAGDQGPPPLLAAHSRDRSNSATPPEPPIKRMRLLQ